MTEPDWNPAQSYSVHDAHDFLTRALTFNDGEAKESEHERQLAMSATLLSLGHVAHHMQDMAQPQHVRNDQHFDRIDAWKSRYEDYTSERQADVRDLGSLANPIASPAFKTARDFWFNDSNSGIAQTVNHDFVSHGTNFMFSLLGNVTTGEYSNPQPTGSTDYPPSQLWGVVPANVETICGQKGVDCTMTMYSTATSQRASTLSIFDQDMRAKGLTVKYILPIVGPVLTGRLFDLNHFNFDDAHPVLIDRAVSYSAGIINHFFRGKLEVSRPAKGPYAVADHSAGLGFTTVRATVKNVTPGEALPGGKIRAIAKYRLNGCYKPDLSGEMTLDGAGQPSFPCTEWRSANQHISVSDEQDVSFGIDQKTEMSFTFPGRIPFDAIELMIQVYYTGKVGAEEESFALGAVDVSEPSFIAIENATDIFELSGQFYYWQDIVTNIAQLPFSNIDSDHNHVYNVPPDIRVEGATTSYQVYLDGEKVADAANVPQGRFTRLAALLSPDGYELKYVATSNFFNITRIYNPGSRLFEVYQQGDGFYWFRSPATKHRTFPQMQIYTMYSFAPSASATLDQMLDSRADSAGTPAPALIVQKYLLGAPPTSGAMNGSVSALSSTPAAEADDQNVATPGRVAPAVKDSAPATPRPEVNPGAPLRKNTLGFVNGPLRNGGKVALPAERQQQ
jgi:hypothetical protein